MCIDGRGGSAASIATAYETPSAYVPVCCLPVHVVWFGAGGGATRISVNESEGNKWGVPIPVFVCARTCARTTWLKSSQGRLGPKLSGKSPSFMGSLTSECVENAPDQFLLLDPVGIRNVH